MPGRVVLLSLCALFATTATALRAPAEDDGVATNVGNPSCLPTLNITIVGSGSSLQDSTHADTVLLDFEINEPPGCPDNSSAPFADIWIYVWRGDGTQSPPSQNSGDPIATVKAGWGPVRVSFGGEVDNRPVPIIASGFSSRYNGTYATQNSTWVKIYYSVEMLATPTELVYKPLGPGSVELSVRPRNASSWFNFTEVTFYRLLPHNLSSNPPTFSTTFQFHEVSATGKNQYTVGRPGIYYYGAVPNYYGRQGMCTAGGFYDGHPSPHPTAFVVLGPNGETGNETIPPNFQGEVVELPPLETPVQLCIIDQNLTIFNGSQLRIPICRSSKAEIPAEPGFFSAAAPSWIQLLPNNNETCQACYGGAYWSYVINQSSFISPSDGQPWTRYTFESKVQEDYSRDRPNQKSGDHGRWDVYNDFIPIFVKIFDDLSIDGGVHQIKVLLHENEPTATSVPLSKWQSLNVRAVATPNVTAPEKLITSITWSSAGFLLDEAPSSPGYSPAGASEANFLRTYAALGFNTVPQVSVPAYFKYSNYTFDPVPKNRYSNFYPGWLRAEHRKTNKAWNSVPNLHYGPETSGPVVHTGALFCKENKPDPAKLPPAAAKLSPARREVELTKWENAYNFSQTHDGALDAAYDGIFFTESNKHFCDVVNVTRPEFIFMDDEAFTYWSLWKTFVKTNSNAQARRLPGETDFNLAWRMILEMFMIWTDCLRSDFPETTLGWYDTVYPDLIFATAGVTQQPSEYSPEHVLPLYIESLRLSKLKQSPLAGKPKSETPLLPWITSCTYGQMTAVETWEGALHTFGSGATGFSFFASDPCFNDGGGKVLALSSAVAAARWYEDIFYSGTPILPSQITTPDTSFASGGSLVVGSGGIRAWSGMQTKLLDGFWMVLTPGSQFNKTEATMIDFTIKVNRGSDGFTLCDVTTGEFGLASNFEIGTKGANSLHVTSSSPLERTTVLYISNQATAAAECRSKSLPAMQAWVPKKGYNY